MLDKKKRNWNGAEGGAGEGGGCESQTSKHARVTDTATCKSGTEGNTTTLIKDDVSGRTRILVSKFGQEYIADRKAEVILDGLCMFML